MHIAFHRDCVNTYPFNLLHLTRRKRIAPRPVPLLAMVRTLLSRAQYMGKPVGNGTWTPVHLDTH